MTRFGFLTLVFRSSLATCLVISAQPNRRRGLRRANFSFAAGHLILAKLTVLRDVERNEPPFPNNGKGTSDRLWNFGSLPGAAHHRHSFHRKGALPPSRKNRRKNRFSLFRFSADFSLFRHDGPPHDRGGDLGGLLPAVWSLRELRNFSLLLASELFDGGLRRCSSSAKMAVVGNN